MEILSPTDARTLYLGISQLIPVFLIALFVLDNTWLARISQQHRHEALELTKEIGRDKEDQELINKLTAAIGEKDREYDLLKSRSTPIRKRQRRAVEDKMAEIAETRARLAGFAHEADKARQEMDAARGTFLDLLPRIADAAERRARTYNQVMVPTIIVGMCGEFLALWGAVGLLDDTAVIATVISISISIAGMLSIIAIDRLLLEVRPQRLRLIQTVWAVLLASSVVATCCLIVGFVRIRS
jgi:hypothetical protein